MSSLGDMFLTYKLVEPEIEEDTFNTLYVEPLFLNLDRVRNIAKSEEITPVEELPVGLTWSFPKYTAPVETNSTFTVEESDPEVDLEGWNLKASLKTLRQNAKSHSSGRCAGAVFDALEAGLETKPERKDAKDVIESGTLERAGFNPINMFHLDPGQNTPILYTPQAGDIAVTMRNSDNTKGHHMAMYDGRQWISDFRLKGILVYNEEGKDWVIYRKSK